MPGSSRPSLLALVLIAPIRFYQRFITPYTPASCRFYPTCSSYAVTALREHGALRGSWLTLRRLGRCHPWSEGGIDHVPPRRSSGSRASGGERIDDASSSPPVASTDSAPHDHARSTSHPHAVPTSLSSRRPPDPQPTDRSIAS